MDRSGLNGEWSRQDSATFMVTTPLPEVHAWARTVWSKKCTTMGPYFRGPFPLNCATYVNWLSEKGEIVARLEVMYNPARVTNGGLAEAHGHIVDLVKAGAHQPDWESGPDVFWKYDPDMQRTLAELSNQDSELAF